MPKASDIVEEIPLRVFGEYDFEQQMLLDQPRHPLDLEENDDFFDIYDERTPLLI